AVLAGEARTRLGGRPGRGLDLGREDVGQLLFAADRFDAHVQRMAAFVDAEAAGGGHAGSGGGTAGDSRAASRMARWPAVAAAGSREVPAEAGTDTGFVENDSHAWKNRAARPRPADPFDRSPHAAVPAFPLRATSRGLPAA